MSINGDLNGDGKVDIKDLNLVLFNWGKLANDLPVEWVHQLPKNTVGSIELGLIMYNWGVKENKMPILHYDGPNLIELGIGDEFYVDNISFSDPDIKDEDLDKLIVRCEVFLSTLMFNGSPDFGASIEGDPTGITFITGNPSIPPTGLTNFTGTMNAINNFLSSIRVYKAGELPVSTGQFGVILYDEGHTGVGGVKSTGITIVLKT
jgi:hypothetical protein